MMLSRIDKLLKAVGEDKAVFITGYPNIYYYSGFTSEDAYLIISKNKRMLITDSRYYVQAHEQAPEFDLVKLKQGWKKIWENVSEKVIAFEEDRITYGFFKQIQSKAPAKTYIKAQRKIDSPRRFKDKEEIKLIKETENIGDMAFSHLLEYIQVGKTERDIALELEIYMKKQGASDLSFETIAASGVRSAMPHGVASEKVIEKGDLLTLDFGCKYHGYCSDMTRTVMIGNPNEKQKEIYETVLKAQTAAIDGIHEGILCSEADKIARDIISNAGYGKNFGHSLGHSVGVEIHEQPCFSPASKDILENGNVLSVEPGIYIEGFGGVRIEDLIAVIDGKTVNLTTSPKELIIL